MASKPAEQNHFSITSDTVMNFAAWAFGELLEDYERYGTIHGVSMDCKASANKFGLSLITINGRTNTGSVANTSSVGPAIDISGNTAIKYCSDTCSILI